MYRYMVVKIDNFYKVYKIGDDGTNTQVDGSHFLGNAIKAADRYQQISKELGEVVYMTL